jgi:hypothetical protein
LTTRGSRAQWLSIPDLTDQILKRTNRFARRITGRSRRCQLQAVRRLVALAEKRDEQRFTKRLGKEIFVKAEAVEALLPDDHETLTKVESTVQTHAKEIKRISVLQSGHGYRLREHAKRIETLEKKQALLAKFQADLAELDSVS